MTEKDRKADLQSELGMTRRDLIRRGAVVGGTLLWAAPVIQSIRTPAFAQSVALHTCCLCTMKTASGGTSHCHSDDLSSSDCDSECAGAANVVKYCTGTNGAACTGTCGNTMISTCQCNVDNGGGFVTC